MLPPIRARMRHPRVLFSVSNSPRNRRKSTCLWRIVKIVSHELAMSSHGNVRYNHPRPTMTHLPTHLSPDQTVRY